MMLSGWLLDQQRRFPIAHANLPSVARQHIQQLQPDRRGKDQQVAGKLLGILNVLIGRASVAAATLAARLLFNWQHMGHLNVS